MSSRRRRTEVSNKATATRVRATGPNAEALAVLIQTLPQQAAQIVMTPQPDRTYHVKSTLYPLAVAMYDTAGSAGSRLL